MCDGAALIASSICCSAEISGSRRAYRPGLSEAPKDSALEIVAARIRATKTIFELRLALPWFDEFREADPQPHHCEEPGSPPLAPVALARRGRLHAAELHVGLPS